MVSTHDYLKKIENDSTFVILLQKGIIPLSILDRKCYYEFFLNERLTNSKVQSISNTSENYNVSEMTIRRAIHFMEN